MRGLSEANDVLQLEALVELTKLLAARPDYAKHFVVTALCVRFACILTLLQGLRQIGAEHKADT